ncbi:MAG: copper chaperone PCu(A)C [Pseudomonadota bacterium]
MRRLSIPTRAFAAFAMLCAAFIGSPALTHDTTVGTITIGHPHARPNLPNRPSAAYLTISNKGDKADRLIAARSDFFGTIELHVTHEKDGVMMMAKVDEITVPAGGETQLEPGGQHLMLFNGTETFKPGSYFEATLTFETAGDVTVTFLVEKPAAGSKSEDHSGHGAKGHSSGGHSGHGSGS